jgi:hypothetical protein
MCRRPSLQAEAAWTRGWRILGYPTMFPPPGDHRALAVGSHSARTQSQFRPSFGPDERAQRLTERTTPKPFQTFKQDAKLSLHRHTRTVYTDNPGRFTP